MPPEKTNIAKNRPAELEKELRDLLLALDEFMPNKTLIKKSVIPRAQNLDLANTLNEFAAILSAHAKSLEKHINAVENLTLAVKQLDITINKEINLASKQPSLELKEAITSFLEYQINPQFYHDSGYLKLPVAPEGMHPETGKKIKLQKQKPSENP